MMERIAEVSPRFKARVAGVFEALEGLTSAYGQVVVLGRLVVAGNAAATAADIVGHERLFWLGFHIAPSRRCFHIVWVFHFYKLFKPVDKGVSLLAAFVGLVVCAMQALTGLLYLAPLLILLGGSSLSAFTEPQLQALALIFLKLNSSAFDVDLVFFGLWCTLTGYLIIRSTFLPRVLGILLATDGLGWMLYIYPPLAYHLFPIIATASALAEFPLQLWLIVFGVNSQRWNEQASAANESRAT
jgi:hypothetical protein